MVGRLVGRLARRPQKSGKKVGHGWHHHSRALRRRSMGQGGITGSLEDAEAPAGVPAASKKFSHTVK